jgi:hypothetical protein
MDEERPRSPETETEDQDRYRAMFAKEDPGEKPPDQAPATEEPPEKAKEGERPESSEE